MTEYAFVLALVALGAATAFTSFGQSVVSMFGPIVKAVAP
jgi:Flp pilus assembly pilin Flp